MKWLQIVLPVVLAGQAALWAAAADGDAVQPKATAPVLRSGEPSDNVVVTLPGAPAVPKPAVAPVSAPIPAPSAPVPGKPPVLPVPPTAAPKLEAKPVKRVETLAAQEPAKSLVERETHAIAKAPKPALPPDFTQDSALFCQKQIGHWKPADARSLMGEARRQRPAYGEDKKTVNGRIYAFSDPSGRYKELELDFDKAGNLRSVFSYPPKMTWKECLRLWGDKVAAADAKQGRTFYSYLDRRLDVLVDQNGNVISLGRY